MLQASCQGMILGLHFPDVVAPLASVVATSVVDCQTTVDKRIKPGTGHLMAEPAASGLAGANDKSTDAAKKS
jgi:hypothetical protein